MVTSERVHFFSFYIKRNKREMWRSLNMVECLYRASSSSAPSAASAPSTSSTSSTPSTPSTPEYTVQEIQAGWKIAKCSDNLNEASDQFIWYTCDPLETSLVGNDDGTDDLHTCLIPYEGLTEHARKIFYKSTKSFNLLDMSKVKTIQFLNEKGISESLGRTFKIEGKEVRRHSKLELDKNLALAMQNANIFAYTGTVGWYHPTMNTFDVRESSQIHRREIMLLSEKVNDLLEETNRVACAPAAPSREKTKAVSRTGGTRDLKRLFNFDD